MPAYACSSCLGPLCESWDSGYSEGSEPDPGKWMVEDGSNRVERVPEFGSLALHMPGSSMAFQPAHLEYTDFEAEVLLPANEDARGTLVARVQDRSLYARYQLVVFPNIPNGVALWARDDDVSLRLSETATFNLAPGCPVFRMRLVVDGNRLRGYVNDALLVEAVDPWNAFPSGRVGMESYGGAWYDNLRLNNTACQSTATPVNTETPTDTATETPTHTYTDTATDTATETPTHTYTDTATDTATETPTHTYTDTATDTATETPTHTYTDTATDTATETHTSIPTHTHTSVQTPAATGTPSLPCLSRGVMEDSGHRHHRHRHDDYEVWPLPAQAVQLGNLVLNGRDARALEPGDYVADSLVLSGRSELRIRGGLVRIWFKRLILAGDAALNPGRAGDLWLFSREQASLAHFHGNAEAHAAVYAPNIRVHLGGTVDLYGAVLGDQVDLSGRARVHYREALGRGCSTAHTRRHACSMTEDYRGEGKEAGLGVLKAGEALRLYPNPAKIRAWVSYRLPESGKGRLLVMSLGGELVKALDLRGPAGEGREALDLAGLGAGTYLAVLQTDEGMGLATRATFKLAVKP